MPIVSAIDALQHCVLHAVATRRDDPRLGAIKQERDSRLSALRGDLDFGFESRLGLSQFERDALLLVACSHIDPHLAELAATAHEHPRKAFVSPWLCLEVLPSAADRLAASKAFLHDAPLFRLGALRSVAHPRDGHNPLLHELVPAGFVLDVLLGREQASRDLAGIARRIVPLNDLNGVALTRDERHRLEALADRLASPAPHFGDWHGAHGYAFSPTLLVSVSGPQGVGKTITARAIAHRAGYPVLQLDGHALGTYTAPTARALLEIAWREAAFRDEWLLVDAADGLESTLSKLITLTNGPAVALITVDGLDTLPDALRRRLVACVSLRAPGRDERSLIWQLNLPEEPRVASDVRFGALGDGALLSGRAIQNAITLSARTPEREIDAQELDHTVALQDQPAFGANARQSQVQRSSEDLIVDEAVSEKVREIILIESVRGQVLNDWGMARRLGRGLGIACLFDGAPGTGKTLCAEVIAAELGLPLYTVNVASIMSKWVGETEKNLQSVFEVAEKNRCVLLFDEADTLFSKRTGVRGANDRHANLEVGLLLQLVEGYTGLVLLTSNLRENIDPAFLRRFAYHVSFAEPDATIREKIWRRLLPTAQLEPDLDIRTLARRFELSGGSIRNVVLKASYRAAAAGERLHYGALSDAAVEECRAMGKLVRLDGIKREKK